MPNRYNDHNRPSNQRRSPGSRDDFRRNPDLTGDDFFYGGQSSQRDDWEFRAFDNNPWDRREGMYQAGGRDFDERARDSMNRRLGPTWTGGDRGWGERRSSDQRAEEKHGFMESVKNFFGVGPKGYKRSDERVREDVSEALAAHPGVDASEIEVTVKEGHVTLAGTVENRAMRRFAEEAVERVPGVVDVHIELSLAAAPSRETSPGTGSPRGSLRHEKPRSGGRAKMQ